jgi:hypothetical protein
MDKVYKSDENSEEIEQDYSNLRNKDKRRNMFEQNEIFSDKANDLENYPKEKKKPLEDPEEFQHLRDICSAFLNYQVDSMRDVSRMERDFSSLPNYQLELLKYQYKERINNLRHAIWRNYSFLLKIVSPYSHMFKFYKNENNEISMENLTVMPRDIIKLRSTLKLFIRDWSKEVNNILNF